MKNIATWLWGATSGTGAGFCLCWYWAAQRLGPRSTPDGEPTNVWQRLAWAVEKIFDSYERK